MKSTSFLSQLTARLWVIVLFCLSLTASADDLRIQPRQPLAHIKVRPNGDEQTWLNKKHTLTVGIAKDSFPPYRIFTNNQSFEGLTADYLSAMERELGINIEVKPFGSAQAAYTALRNGDVDLVGSATRQEALDYDVRLTSPYAITELALFSEGGDLREYSTHDPRTRIAVANSVALALYRGNGGQGVFTSYPSPLAAMASVLTGESDVYLGDTFSNYYLSSQLFSNQLVVNQSAQLPKVEIGFAYAPDNTVLARLFDRGLSSINRCQMARAQYLWGDIDACDPSGFRQRLSEPERAWLDKNEKVVLAISEDLAPYAFFNGRGRFNGISSELLDIIRRKTGIRFTITRVSSLSEADDLLHNGEASIGVLPEISEVPFPYLHTRALETAPYLFVMRQENEALLDVNSTARVAVAKGYLLIESLSRQYPNVRIEQTDTMGEAFKLVREGSADFVVAPANVARYYLSYKYENSLKVGGILNGPSAKIVFAAPKNLPELISIFDKAMIEIPPRDYLQITGRWRANSATDDKYWEGIASFIWRSFEILGVLLLVAAWFIFAQRRRIRRKRHDLQQRQILLDELEVAKESAEKASRSKSVFLATMSHEIRTPLNAIIGMLELVLTRRDNAELNVQSVHIAYESATHLLGLIGDILDISRIESGKLTLMPESARVKELLESVCNVFSGLARHKQLQMNIDIDPLAAESVWVDGLKIKQILSNLLSNAIKFTEHGQIDVRCQVTASDDATLHFRISVSDTGVGIPPTQIDRIFQPFFITHDAIGDPNAGAGLGLTISKALSELMDGRLEVESESGRGTHMTLLVSLQRISADTPVSADDPDSSSPQSSETQLTVLIVEDHLPSQYLLYQQITYLGHRALTASNGLEGVAVWQENRIDIVITDCNMPELSGHEMTKSIRRLEQRQSVRPCVIIGLTADAQREELDRCVASGMNHALAKPINLAGLNRLIPKRDTDDPHPKSEFSRMNDIRGAMADQVIASNLGERAALQQALDKGDVAQIDRTAHKLKGTAYLLNLSGLLEQCVEVNDLCAEEHMTDELAAAVSELMLSLERISQSLQPD